MFDYNFGFPVLLDFNVTSPNEIVIPLDATIR